MRDINVRATIYTRIRLYRRVRGENKSKRARRAYSTYSRRSIHAEAINNNRFVYKKFETVLLEEDVVVVVVAAVVECQYLGSTIPAAL